MKEKLLIHAVNEAYSFAPEQIVCIEADGNYCNFYLSNGNSYLLSYQLGQIESIIKEQLSYSSYSFVRVGKSLIVNADEVLCVNLTKQTLELSTTSGEKLQFSASREALKKLMSFLVENRKNGIVRSINHIHSAPSKSMVLLRGHHQTTMPDDDIRVICNG
jgi:DNA-binding LytR/AlgR family response regulator